MKFIASLFLMTASIQNTSTFEEIEDTSALPLLNPDLKSRNFAKLKLQNGLEMLLVSDPGIDQSSASMAVRVGSWDDPDEYPGMAHFCEHMLFMGSHKYPESNDFMTRISDAGGITNAYTAPHRTVYTFSCKHDSFLENLDRFSRFFIDPLFDPANISRELHAVDQEYAKNLEHDGWREMMIFKEMGNPNHPNRKFSSGNSETLKNIPSIALQDWHQTHYAAEKMHLFVCSNLPLPQLKEQMTAMFAAIPNPGNSSETQETTSGPIHLTSSLQKGHITYIKPVQNKQSLSLSWELPLELSDDETKSAELVAYALNRGQSNSLYELLKREQLIDSVSVHVDDLGGKEHKFFSVFYELSDKGMGAIGTAVLRFFEAVQGLKAGIPKYLFEEKNVISQLTYQYQARQDAFQTAESTSDSLSEEELATFPRRQVLATSYSPEKCSQTLDVLKLEDCIITLIASPKLTGIEPEKKEQWFGAEYATRSIPSDWMALWKGAKPNAEIQIPEPNAFLPTRFEMAPQKEPTSMPILVAETENGLAYYARCSEFSAPEAVIHLHLRSPELQATAKSSVLASLYLDHITDVLQPILSQAKSAGLSTRFELEKQKIHLQINGFNDKAPLLLEKILEQLPQRAPTKEEYAIYFARHQKMFESTEKALPLMQAKDLMESLLMEGRSSNPEKLAALHTITYEQLLEFHRNLFEKTYVEALFSGNLTLKEAQSSWLDVQHIFNKKTYTKKEHTKPKVLELPSTNGPFSIFKATGAQGNSTILSLDAGPFSLEQRASHEILGLAIRDAFFNELRTKQKTGYIAKAEPAEIEEKLFYLFMVQSNSHNPEDLLYRFELFLEEFREAKQQNISEHRFEILKKTAIHSLNTRFRNLKDKAALWNLLAFEKRADFRYIEKRIAALENLSYETFLEFLEETLSRKNLRRLAVLFEGRTPSFTYQSIEPKRLLELGRYVMKSELEKQ